MDLWRHNITWKVIKDNYVPDNLVVKTPVRQVGDVVIDEIEQLNFNRRKTLDKLFYEKKVKSQKLIDLKLEQAVLEDRLKYAFLGQIKEEKEAQIITGKVQDAILRKEAAWSIQRIYTEIRDIMKKDALYFDAILATVTNDGYHQSKCFLGATKLGQLATEYLDDRRQEYDTLEKIILKDMGSRKTDIKVLHEQVNSTSDSIKLLLRKDSDINTCAINIAESQSVHELNKDIGEVEKTLKFLKNTTLVNSYSAIYPCLDEQFKQHRRLKHLAEKFERDRDTLLNKTNHAELMNNVLKNTANDYIAEYLYKKQEYKNSIIQIREENENCAKLLRKKHEVAAQIRIALRQLLQLSYNLKPPETMKKKSSSSTPHPFNIAQEKEKKMEIPDEDEIDGRKLISIINKKFSVLMATYFALPEKTAPDEAYESFEQMMQARTIFFSKVETALSESSLLQGLYTEATTQLTREDIKKQSKELVGANTRNEDMVPVFIVPTKSRLLIAMKKSKSKKL
ncbi:hypothetical protein Zmor_007198 [Zophobas morio]|uniref:Uncharacterized protein n=1 Tax=Zophobas morio TaxID=2755281 RepID=A0AA38J1F7_9CUCU|nr:hypothetical protein Zmor_007180 [Zophobas morio]KAJ3662879.1 hypothetical protein Zmor_007198 [Zophobas morio]